MKIGSEEARRKLPELLERAHAGEQLTITKRGVEYAVLVPVDRPLNAAGPGLLSLRGSGAGMWGDDPGRWVESLREEWS